ncbi:MAG: polyprenyl synthetase family protein [Candidatus Aminicenantes bacterium]|jgi:octaprenyl-diphosphate synthase
MQDQAQFDTEKTNKELKSYFDTRLKKRPSLTRLYKSIKDDLNDVEKTLCLFTKSSNVIISEISSYLFQKSGKRIRPALLILCAKLLGYKGKEHILLSSLVESIHTASLLHDDIIDNSDTRRGKQTVHARWGPNITVLLGDYLYIKTLGLSLESNHREIIKILTDVSAEMIDGELFEYYMSGNLDIQESEYLEILDKKTASLFAASCQIAGLLGGASTQEQNRLIAFGQNLGMSFQLIDDLLDFSGDEGVLGKPVLSDLSERRITFPLIYTIRSDGEKNRNRISSILKEKVLSEESKQEILSMVKANGALDYTYLKAEEFSLKSKEQIEQFPKSAYRDTLAMVSDFVLNRMK